MMMGYTELHFLWVYDSCMGITDEDHHVYPFTDPTKEFLGDIYNLKIGMGEANGPGVREYRVAGYQLAQADHYKPDDYRLLNSSVPKPIFHGPGSVFTDMRSHDRHRSPTDNHRGDE